MQSDSSSWSWPKVEICQFPIPAPLHPSTSLCESLLRMKTETSRKIKVLICSQFLCFSPMTCSIFLYSVSAGGSQRQPCLKGEAGAHLLSCWRGFEISHSGGFRSKWNICLAWQKVFLWCSAGREGVLLLEMSFTITGAAPVRWDLVFQLSPQLCWSGKGEGNGSRPYFSKFILSPSCFLPQFLKQLHPSFTSSTFHLVEKSYCPEHWDLRCSSRWWNHLPFVSMRPQHNWEGMRAQPGPPFPVKTRFSLVFSNSVTSEPKQWQTSQ